MGSGPSATCLAGRRLGGRGCLLAQDSGGQARAHHLSPSQSQLWQILFGIRIEMNFVSEVVYVSLKFTSVNTQVTASFIRSRRGTGKGLRALPSQRAAEQAAPSATEAGAGSWRPQLLPYPCCFSAENLDEAREQKEKSPPDQPAVPHPPPSTPIKLEEGELWVAVAATVGGCTARARCGGTWRELC